MTSAMPVQCSTLPTELSSRLGAVATLLMKDLPIVMGSWAGDQYFAETVICLNFSNACVSTQCHLSHCRVREQFMEGADS